MYQISLYFRLNSTHDKKNILQMFFKDWADRICDNEVKYSIIENDGNKLFWSEIIRVDFKNQEDATIMKLRGVPEEFQEYLTLT